MHGQKNIKLQLSCLKQTVEFLVYTRKFSIWYSYLKLGFWGPPKPCAMGTADFVESKGAGMKLTSHLHLVLSLRMSGVLPLLPSIPPWRG